ncbi:MAG: hypothetical protein ACRDYE_02160 [Acidimicrobiales bacterium]
MAVTPGADDPPEVPDVDDEAEAEVVVVVVPVEDALEQLAITSAEASNSAPMAAEIRVVEPPLWYRMHPP